jgi:hypothetical protein
LGNKVFQQCLHNVPVKWTKQGFCKPYATPSSRQLSDSLPIMTT